jgi:predicted ATPase
MASSAPTGHRFFLSYRREDAAGHAGRLADNLLDRFGAGSVFMDIESIGVGADFTEEIDRAIADADAVLVLIGPAWLEATTESGTRRLDEPGDFVRREVEAALGSDLRVIPVLVGGSAMPAEKHLPQPIAALARRNALELLDRRWREDVDALVDVLEGRARTQASTPTGNLPLQPTAFLGRERETAEVLELLRRRDVRILTLIGPGGIGKTRLAVQAAGKLADTYPGGVWFVGLAAITDAELVLPEVARVLEVREGQEDSLVKAIADRLSRSRVLLVLDNLEQLLPEAAAPISGLSAAAPTLDLIVSSRERLHIAAEREYPLATLSDDDALAMFVQRASSVHPGFAIRDDDERGAVTAICARLDRLPLAIELAAARIKLLAPAEILARLERRLPLLTGGTRDAPERQRTLRSAIAWSYDLLSQDERRLFERLAVFSGGFTPEAAEAVCDAEIDALQALLERSLLREQAGSGPVRRYEMLETIREFAVETLRSSGEDLELESLHEDYFLSFVLRACSELRGPDPVPWFEVLENEMGNLRSAIATSMAHGRILMALRLVGPLTAFWEPRGYWGEARAWLDQVLARSAGLQIPERAQVLFAAGGLSWFQGEIGTSRALLEQAVELARQIADRRTLALASARLAWIRVMQSPDVQRAGGVGEEGVDVARELGDPWVLAEALNDLANAYGDLAYSPRSVSLLEESLQLRRSIGDVVGVTDSLNGLGYENVLCEDYPKAIVFLQEGLGLARRLADRRHIVLAQGNLALAHLFDGEPELAEGLFRESLRACREIGDKRIVEEILIGMAGVAALELEFEEAAWLAGAASGLAAAYEVSPAAVTTRIHERFLVDARRALGGELYEASFDHGRSTPFDEAVSHALGEDRHD